MKKWSVLFLIAIVLLSSCGNNNSAKNHESNSEKSVAATISPTPTLTPTPKPTVEPNQTPQPTIKPTQKPDDLCFCGKKGNNVCLGDLGERFYYCDEHYKEFSYKYNHPCEECRHIGEYKVRNPISGAVEYYCEEHYKKIIEAVDSMSRY